MKNDLFIQKTSNIFAENRLLKFCMIVLSTAVVLCMIIALRAAKYQKTIILPPDEHYRVVVSASDANDDYVKLFTRYCMNLLLNYTPGLIENQMEDVLKMATPGFYPELKLRLMELADNAEKAQIVSVFYPNVIEVDTIKKEILVTGLRKKFTHSTIIENGQKKYLINYLIIYGRFYINGLSEKNDKN